MSLSLLFIYTFLYVTLNSQDFALLMGSLGLFVILAAIMYLSKIILAKKTSSEDSKSNKVTH